MLKKGAVFALGMVSVATTATGQSSAPPAQHHAKAAVDYDSDEDPTIVVEGQKPRGSVIGDIKPEVQLSPADIRAYGVSSISDLLDELASQTRSDRGRGGEAPVVLLNGRRISSFSEIRDIPTEAIQRVEILPEEVALKYGYTADQRVVNIVLRKRFRSITGQLDGGFATEGGAANEQADANLLRIHGESRVNLDIKYKSSASLTDAERGIIPQNIATVAPSDSSATHIADYDGTASADDLSRSRTLQPASHDLTVNSVLSRTIFGNVAATVNGTVDVNSSDSLTGLPRTNLTIPVGDPYSTYPTDVTLGRYLGSSPLTQGVNSFTGHLGFSLNGDLKPWRWSFTGNFDHADTRTTTLRGYDVSAIQAQLLALSPTLNPFGPLSPGGPLNDTARALSNSGDIQLVASGPLFNIPAGQVLTTVKLGFEGNGFDAYALQNGIARSSSLSRGNANGQFNLDVPLTSRRNNFLPFIGDLSANLNVAVRHLSDFGTLTTLGYGANWTPVKAVSLIISYTDDQGAPTVQQLGNPVVLTPDSRVFDYLRGQTVDITQINGGNISLHADDRHVLKLGLTLKPFPKTDLTFTANYIHSSIRNAITALPEPTAAMQLAYPDRFIRDAEGDLTSIDVRPINIEREDRQELRWGINFSKPLKSSQKVIDAFRQLRQEAIASGAFRPRGGDGARDGQSGAPAAGGQRGGGGGGRSGANGAGGGRLQFAFYHTWYFRDDVLIRQGVPMLDLLNGGTLGASGGQPRHELELQLGYSNNGIGARLTGQWNAATNVRGDPTSPDSTLHFSDLATANLRLFVNLGQRPSLMKQRWARGARVTLSITNLFDSRLHVHDGNGDTPLRYQPAYIDPVGRAVKISLRKLFF